MSKIVDAATALLLCEGQMFMARRHCAMPIFPGYHAFPGGKVDAADSDAPLSHPLLAPHPPRVIRALLRELHEELGLDVLALCERGEITRIHYLGNALTPPIASLRFNTWFFKIVLKTRPVMTMDTREHDLADWASPAQWRERYERGEILLAPPTRATVEVFSTNADADAVPGLDFDQREFSELPMVEVLRGVRQIFVRSNTLPPAIHTNCFLLGDAQSHRILVDPSPNTREELEQLKTLCQRLVIHEVFLTHHHPDHRQYANELALHFNAPLGLSQVTYDFIKGKEGLKFFAGLSINTYQEGDVLCRWLGQPVRVLNVPGHDEGQLALMPDNRAWCIVGDLIQGIGTVVIAKPEGHMGRYYQSLQKIIALKPRVIYPSHGGGMGSTYRLEETLRHRQMREAQIQQFLAEGRTPDEMLPLIYQNLDPRLLPLARMNIESHMDKLREEGAAV